MPIVLRYVDEALDIKERFVKFVYCQDGITGEAISTYLKTELRSLGLDLTKCHGQGYDEAGNMAGRYIGTAKLFQDEYLQAIYIHCASHRLNLCIVDCCQIQFVSKMMGITKRVSDFFNNLPKHQEALPKAIKDNRPNERHTKLLDICWTRWIERVKGLEHFIDMYPAVIATLENMDQNNNKNWNRDTSSDASTLRFNS